ncbi:MAG: HNH endonuclease [Clostridia bacterium]|nr:HNH endonuclease [Clostridia bacterium]
MNNRRAWTREEEIVVFNLYCKIPFQRSSKNHPDVIRIANLIDRSPSSVNMKIGNFGSFDESLSRQGIVGLTNASKLDKEIWDEFCGNWDELAFESERIIANLQGKSVDDGSEIENIPYGMIRTATVKQRVNQRFFRSAVLSAYADSCCITGLNNTILLIASHIKPWVDSTEFEKTNPCNGLCLNALHDKAFDKGFITVTPDCKIHISSDVSDVCNGETVDMYFKRFENKKITIPQKFAPSKMYLEYHNDMIFEHWK